MKKLLLALMLVGAAFAQNPKTAVFPGRAATDTDLMVASNNVITNLSASVAGGDTTINVVTTAGILVPTALSIDSEILLACTKTSTSFGICPNGRGFDGTAAASHSNGTAVNFFIVAGYHNQAAAEIKAIETNILTTSPFTASIYNFPAQTPGGTLTGGVGATVTMNPCPTGVNGSDTGHYLYVSNGVGTAEAVLIQGGTCASIGTGTVIFTPTFSHSGSWTLTSGSGGIFECLESGGTLGSCVLPAGITHTKANLTIPFSSSSLLGLGEGVSFIQADFNSGNVITINGLNNVTLKDFGVYRVNGYSTLPSNGDTIGVYGSSAVYLTNLWLRHNWNGVNTLGTTSATTGCINGATLGNCSTIYMDNISVEGAANAALIGFQGTSDLFNYIIAQAGGLYTVSYTPGEIILLGFTNGAFFNRTLIGGPVTSAQILYSVPSCTGCLSDLTSWVDLQIDSWTGGPAFKFGGTLLPTNINIDASSISNSGSNTNPVFRFLVTVAGLQISNSRFVNLGSTKIFDGAGDTGQATSLVFSNNNIINTSNGIASMTIAAGNIMTFTNNNWYVGLGATPTYDIEFTAAIPNLTVTGNNFGNYSTAGFHFTATPASGVIENNNGADNVPQTVASASSISLTPGYTLFKVTGTTGVGTITGLYEGRRLEIITTDGAVVFTAGTTIGNTITSTQNVPLVGRVLGGKLYLK
jgi:hypothetical protein